MTDRSAGPAGPGPAPGAAPDAPDARDAPDALTPAQPPVDYEPPWREARRRVALAWARGGVVPRIALLVAGVIAAGLLGAFLFGLWHVVVGGLLKGNVDAAGFGFALAGVAGVLLWIEASVAKRVLPA